MSINLVSGHSPLSEVGTRPLNSLNCTNWKYFLALENHLWLTLSNTECWIFCPCDTPRFPWDGQSRLYKLVPDRPSRPQARFISNILFLISRISVLYLAICTSINITSVGITALPERLVACPSTACPLCLCTTAWPGSGDNSSRVYLFSSSVSCLLSAALQILVTAHMRYEVSNITRNNLYLPVTAGLVEWVCYYCWRIKFLWTFPWRAWDSRAPGCKKAVERDVRCDGECGETVTALSLPADGPPPRQCDDRGKTTNITTPVHLKSYHRLTPISSNCNGPRLTPNWSDH